MTMLLLSAVILLTALSNSFCILHDRDYFNESSSYIFCNFPEFFVLFNLTRKDTKLFSNLKILICMNKSVVKINLFDY